MVDRRENKNTDKDKFIENQEKVNSESSFEPSESSDSLSDNSNSNSNTKSSSSNRIGWAILENKPLDGLNQ